MTIAFREDISRYGLYITEDDGEVDWAFPCLDPRETISKFEFTTLGLIEMKPSDRARHNTISCVEKKAEENLDGKDKEQEEVANDLAKMEGHTTAMEAPLYQSYRYFFNNRVLYLQFFTKYFKNSNLIMDLYEKLIKH